jgi:thiol:disulfide interchange protein DsbD
MRLILTLLLAAASLPGAAVQDDHVKVTLLAEHEALAPGKTVWLGVRLEHEPHWHTYWINPGDSGLPTRLSWQLPPGFHAGEIAWPAPARIKVADLYNFGYEGDILLPVPVAVSVEAQPGTTAHLQAQAKWLVCREECIPGKASLALDLPVRSATATAAVPRNAPALFDAARATQPRAATWSGEARERDGNIEITLQGAELPMPSDALLVQRKVVNYTPPQISRTHNGMKFLFPESDYFGVAPVAVDLIVFAGAHAWSVSVPFSVKGPNNADE